VARLPDERSSRAGSADERFSIICVSPQDWSTTLPTNRQQLMLRAARRGHTVLFIENGGFLGTHLYHLFRRSGRASLARRLFATERVAARIQVRKALNVVPWAQRYRFARRSNALATAVVARFFGRRLPMPRVLWLYDPCGASLIGRSGEALAAYDCVDDYSEQVGGDARRRANVAAADREAGKRAALVFATTEPLYRRHAAINDRVQLVANGADFTHFAQAQDLGTASETLLRLPQPRLGFVGNLTAEKVDFALLYEVARTHPAWTVLLVGPVRAESRSQVDALNSQENVHLLGPQPYAALPQFVAAFDVCLIPYANNAYTRSCFPLKLYEYLAAGRPVVATGLPALAEMGPDVQLVDGPDEFAKAVAAAITNDDEAARARRVKSASAHTWDHRAATLIESIATELRRRCDLAARSQASSQSRRSAREATS
jgi:glycosyltransferase involved in cell wall biosynthesis